MNGLAPRLGTTLLVATICFGPLAFGATEPWSRAILVALIFCLLIVTTFDSNTNACDSFNFCRMTLLPACAILATLAFVQASNPNPLFGPNFGWPSTTSAHASYSEGLLYVAYAAFLWASSSILQRDSNIKVLAWTIFGLGACIALAGIVQQGTDNTLLYGFRRIQYGKPFGPYVNRNNAACLLTTSLSIGAGVLLDRYLNRVRNQDLGKFGDFAAQQITLVMFLGLITFGLWRTQSRGGIVAAIGGALAFLGLSAALAKTSFARWTLRIGLLIAVILIGFFAARNPTFFGFPNNLLDAPLDFSIYTRLAVLRNAGQMISDFPIWGSGIGAFRHTYLAYQESYQYGFIRYAHSDWLELLIEGGIFSFTVVTISLTAVAWKGLRTVSAFSHESHFGVQIGLLSAAVAFLIHSLVEFNFQIPANAVMFLVICSAISSFTHAGKRSRDFRPSGKFRIGVQVVITLLSLGLAGQSARPAIAEALLERGRSSRPESKPYFYAKAFLWDPAPGTQFLLGLSYVRLARTEILNSPVLLRGALTHALLAAENEPLTPTHRQLVSMILRSLRRDSDAETFSFRTSKTERYRKAPHTLRQFLNFQ